MGQDCVGRQIIKAFNQFPHQMINCTTPEFNGFVCYGYQLSLCARGWYCPTPKINYWEPCRPGQWCVSGSAAPMQCSSGAICDDWYNSKNRWVMPPAIVLGLLVFVALVIGVWRICARLCRSRPRADDLDAPLDGGLAPSASDGSRGAAFTLTFDQLSVDVTTRGGKRKTILHPISGKFRSGSVDSLPVPRSIAEFSFVS